MNNFILKIAVVALLVACNAKKTGGHVAQLDSVVSSHCVGRNFISVPAPFFPTSVISGQFKTATMTEKDPAIEVLVNAGPWTVGGFAAEVAKRRAEISRRTNGDVDVLRSEKSIDDQTTFFRVQRVEGAYISEVLLLRGGSIVNISLKSYNNKYQLAEERLTEFASSIRSAPEGHRNVGREGFCIGGVTVYGDMSKEAAVFHFRDGRGSTLEVDVDTYEPDADVPLHARMSGPNSLLTVFDVGHRVLRSGERTVGGMRAHEWLGRAKTGEQQDTYVFALETTRMSPGKRAPKIHLSLETGERLENGTMPGNVMTDEEAIHLWDIVSNSIQPSGS